MAARLRSCSAGHRGDPGPVHVLQQVQLVADVEVGRFVEQEQFGLLGEGTGELAPLTFTAGKGVRSAVREPGQVHPCQGFDHRRRVVRTVTPA
jgi:hypothetical protein